MDLRRFAQWQNAAVVLVITLTSCVITLPTPEEAIPAPGRLVITEQSIKSAGDSLLEKPPEMLTRVEKALLAKVNESKQRESINFSSHIISKELLPARRIVITDDATVAIFAQDKQLYQLRANPEATPQVVTEIIGSIVDTFAFKNPSQQFLGGKTDFGELYLWDLSEKHDHYALNHNSYVINIASERDNLIVTTGEGTVYRWKIEDGFKLDLAQPKLENDMIRTAVIADGSYILGTVGGQVLKWDGKDEGVPSALSSQFGAITTIKHSKSNSLIGAGSSAGITTFIDTSSNAIYTLEALKSPIRDITFAPSHAAAIVTQMRGNAVMWQLGPEGSAESLLSSQSTRHGLSADGRFSVFLKTNGKFEIWNNNFGQTTLWSGLKKPERLDTSPLDEHYCLDFVLTDQLGTTWLLATTDKGEVLEYPLMADATVTSIFRNAEPLTKIKLSENSKRLVVVANDQSVYAWDWNPNLPMIEVYADE